MEMLDHVSLQRDNDHNITLTTHAKPSKDLPEQYRAPGDLSENVEELSFSTKYGAGILRGVALRGSVTSWGGEKDQSQVEYAISEVAFKLTGRCESAYVVDHLDNLPHDFSWPSGFDDNMTKKGMRTFDESFQFPIDSDRERMSFSCMKVEVGPHVCLLSTLDEKKLSDSKDLRGHLIYEENLDEEVRRNIRLSLSYALGLPLIYCGCASYSSVGKLCSFTALTPERINGRVWNMRMMPPAPLTDFIDDRHELVSPDKVSRIASGIYNNMHHYGIDSLPWRLWHADAAPYFMQPAYYGAMIEGIQKHYLRSNPKNVDALLIPKTQFKKHKTLLSRYITKQKLPNLIERSFLNALNHSNAASQAVKSKRFYECLGLALGELEMSAWQRRNDAAHGNEIPHSKKEEFTRSTYILKTMLNRIILTLTEGSDRYIDYYNLDHPDRALSDPVEAPTSLAKS